MYYSIGKRKQPFIGKKQNKNRFTIFATFANIFSSLICSETSETSETKPNLIKSSEALVFSPAYKKPVGL